MSETGFPRIRTVGLTGLLVSFADRLSEPANRAALAFRAVVAAEGWAGVEETSTSLASVFLRFDPLRLPHAELTSMLEGLLAGRDWTSAALPEGRRHWRIPTVYGGDRAPQLAEAGEAAGVKPETARDEIAGTRVRVLTIGFAPGQPYLGELPPHWDIPRQTALTPRVPAGALVVAVRQLVLFSRSAPTGWRHIGQTGFHGFRPGTDTPFPLSPGDQVTFVPVSETELSRYETDDPLGGGATSEPIA